MDTKLLSIIAVVFGTLVWVVYLLRIFIYSRPRHRSQLSKLLTAVAIITGMAAIISGGIVLNSSS